MSKQSLRTALKRIGGLVAATVCLAAPVQAAVYTGVWDPAYGAPFTHLGWRGTAEYFVPDSCEPAGTIDVSNASACGGAAVLTKAEVQLYDLRDTSEAPVATLDIDESTMLIGTLRYVDGALSQLTTSASAALNPVEDLSAVGVGPAVEFFLLFTLTGPQLGWLDCSDERRGCNRGFNDDVNYRPEFLISRVPEPASLGLSALALLSLWGTRRLTRPVTRHARG
jgi:hypothetical protein